MSKAKNTTQSFPTQPNFEAWIAELQALSSSAFPAQASRQAARAARAELKARRRSARYRYAESNQSLTTALLSLGYEIARGSFPGLNGGVSL